LEDFIPDLPLQPPGRHEVLAISGGITIFKTRETAFQDAQTTG